VTVQAVDSFGNIDTNYIDTIHFTCTDPSAVLPPDYTFQTSNAGMATFPGGVTLVTPGTQTLTVTDVNSGITGSVSIP
jgi:adhesin/invasin